MGAQKRTEREEGRKTKKSQDFRSKIDLIYLMLVSVSCKRKETAYIEEKDKKECFKNMGLCI